jgi:hypothetical protein
LARFPDGEFGSIWEAGAADDPAGGGAVSLTRIRARLVNFEEWRRRTSRDTGFPGEMEEGHLRRRSIAHPSYPFDNARHWRMRAEKMRTMAGEAIDLTVRAMMVGIAADYDRRAESADDPGAHDTVMF